MKNIQFSAQMVLVVLRIKYVCSGFLCHDRSDQSEFMALCMAFNLWIGPGFIFE